LSNIRIDQTNHPLGPDEKGFSRPYKQRRQAVLDAVMDADALPAIVTGHRPGGALAALAASDLAISGTAIKMCNFASLRMGNTALGGGSSGKVRVFGRPVNREDWVPAVPVSTPNLESGKSAHGLLGVFSGITPKPDFEHVGTPVSVTSFMRSIPAS